MKIRAGFVSNSSSSSFLLVGFPFSEITETKKDGKDMVVSLMGTEIFRAETSDEDELFELWEEEEAEYYYHDKGDFEGTTFVCPQETGPDEWFFGVDVLQGDLGDNSVTAFIKAIEAAQKRIAALTDKEPKVYSLVEENY